ncbi:MAG: CoA transferase [Alphaproteobacteria bacterium]|nr:CoA transferase [Alphaproteobacteria bacterium]
MTSLNDSNPGEDLPLSGIRVVDFSGYVAGPFCTMLLGDMGADVIKVESPSGEQWRHQDPFAPGISRSFMALNRNKRSVIINLKDPEDQEKALKLLETADVMVSNFRPGVAERYGLDYDTLKVRFPRLIFTSNTAYGESGPRSQQPGYDLVVQAFSGLLSTNPAPDGGVPKRYAGVALVDFTAGHYMLYGIMCALFQRHRTNKGQKVEASLLEAAMGLQRQRMLTLENVLELPLESGTTITQMAKASESSNSIGARELYYRTYQTADGFVTVGCLNVAQRCLFLKLLQMEDPWHSNPDDIPANKEIDQARRALTATAEQHMRAFSTQEWISRMEAVGIPNAALQMLSQVIRDPQVTDNNFLYEYDFPGYGRVQSVGTGVRVGAGGRVRRPPPKLGEHTEEILQELGLNNHKAGPGSDDRTLLKKSAGERK